jgi:hypothetical protein
LRLPAPNGGAGEDFVQSRGSIDATAALAERMAHAEFQRTVRSCEAAMGTESAAAAIDFADLIDDAVRNKNGREEFDAALAQLDGIHEHECCC